MAKEETGRLLSKVAKFVRNPLKDWSQLDASASTTSTPDSASAADSGYSREGLKELIARRQRNDFVRRREFDALRKLRQREVEAEPTEVAAVLSSFNSSSDEKTAGRELTLKKIDEIEEQMSQQWWKGRGEEGDVLSQELAARRARAYTEAAAHVPVDPQQAAAEALAAVRASGLVFSSGLEEAAVRFAVGDDAGTEALLVQLLATDAQVDDDEAWLALLDMYRAIGNAEKFASLSMRYAQRFKRPGPEWMSLRALAHDIQSALTPLESGANHSAAAAAASDWVSPMHLDREGLGELARCLSSAGPVWTLDWRVLQSIGAEAASPLHTLFSHWADSPVQLRFLGAQQLRMVLERSTPLGDRRTDALWWMLRMTTLRMQNQLDLHELASVGYCVTYGELPSPWTDPVGRYEALDSGGPMGGPAGMTLQGLTEQAPPVPEYPMLVGQLSGEIRMTLRRLNADLVQAQQATVSCAPLVRVDCMAAHSILEWAREQETRGNRLSFVEVHRLLAVFFRVMGIGNHVNLAVRAK